MRVKNVAPKIPDCGPKFECVYSKAWMLRKVEPSKMVSASPMISPRRFPRTAARPAKCIGKLLESRMTVLMPTNSLLSSK